MNKLRNLAKIVGVALVTMAVVQELQKPKEQRTWQGTVLGFVPYDFRMPTVERFLEAYWNPADPHIFTPRVIGIGWAVNLPSLFRVLQQVVVQLRAGCHC